MKARENVSLLLSRAGELEKVEVFSATFIFVRLALKNPRPLRPQGKSGTRKTCPCWRRIMLGNV